jgi:hypothetical protein
MLQALTSLVGLSSAGLCHVHSHGSFRQTAVLSIVADISRGLSEFSRPQPEALLLHFLTLFYQTCSLCPYDHFEMPFPLPLQRRPLLGAGLQDVPFLEGLSLCLSLCFPRVLEHEVAGLSRPPHGGMLPSPPSQL